MRAKNVGRESSEKSPKTSCFFSHEYRDQKGGEKRAKQFFQKHTNSASNNFWENNRLKKVRKHVFLYSHEYHNQKVGRKMRQTIFPEMHE